ncbi:MATE family efflux transporter [Ruminococcus sp. 210702-SL.1.03]|uniref:MATE family efflux transporter n=1 Tax=Ruminococcus sp. 210702-SL.1.03 TaxID=2883233 RepID=UPI001D099415|nr:MATE family efflux transporter [Ruminococcus sp. 210702-SL.1.03]MCB6615218.1 MATE family efflux transporter [Ruminococcus sp. 210702-SL.1.03]
MARSSENIDFGSDSVMRILLRLAPPVMAAQLIQALYNIVDSFFVGKCSATGLTALSIIYPLQLLMIAIAVGTGVGINTLMAHYMGIGKRHKSDEAAGTGVFLAGAMWLIFAAICYAIMPFYAKMSTPSADVARDVVAYGRIVCVFSFGLFFESIWTKVLQAEGNMKRPMAAQIIGAVVNIVLDPLLIFGLGFFPKLGISGAAIATVTGQIATALIVMRGGLRRSPALAKYRSYIRRIYTLGFPNILMQSAYTFYILGLNLILKGFSDNAVTALGLYYKWQSFFFIPLGAMQTCIVPLLSFNYAARRYDRCRRTLKDAVLLGFALMAIGTLCFELIPTQMLSVFTDSREVISIGAHGFRFIGVSFIPMVTSLIFPVFFQAINSPAKSSLLTILRTVVLFVPLGWIFARFGLYWFWLTFPITEVITTAAGAAFYRGWRRDSPTYS